MCSFPKLDGTGPCSMVSKKLVSSLDYLQQFKRITFSISIFTTWWNLFSWKEMSRERLKNHNRETQMTYLKSIQAAESILELSFWNILTAQLQVWSVGNVKQHHDIWNHCMRHKQLGAEHVGAFHHMPCPSPPTHTPSMKCSWENAVKREVYFATHCFWNPHSTFSRSAWMLWRLLPAEQAWCDHKPVTLSSGGLDLHLVNPPSTSTMRPQVFAEISVVRELVFYQADSAPGENTPGNRVVHHCASLQTDLCVTCHSTLSSPKHYPRQPSPGFPSPWDCQNSVKVVLRCWSSVPLWVGFRRTF